MTQFLPSDIFLKRYGMNRDMHAGAVILLENGWALHISQSDISTPTMPIQNIPLENATFTCETMRPWPNTPGSEPKILGCNSDHGLTSFGIGYSKTNMSLADVAKTLTALSKRPAASKFTIEEIVDANRTKKAPYSPSQIGKTPIDYGSGAELDTDAIRENLRKGILREPFDYSSPLKHEFFKDGDLHFQQAQQCNDGNYDFATILLPTGHALDIAGREGNYTLTTLTPNKKLRLTPKPINGLELPFDDSKGFATGEHTAEGFSEHEITDILNGLLRRRTITPPHQLQAIVARNKGTDYGITQFNHVPFDPDTGTPLGITLIEPGSAPGDRHP